MMKEVETKTSLEFKKLESEEIKKMWYLCKNYFWSALFKSHALNKKALKLKQLLK
jgi:hypothetical protein